MLFDGESINKNNHELVLATLCYSLFHFVLHEYCENDITVLQSAEGLEGDITVPGLSAPGEADDQEFNTLDEPVRETIVSTGRNATLYFAG